MSSDASFPLCGLPNVVVSDSRCVGSLFGNVDGWTFGALGIRITGNGSLPANGGHAAAAHCPPSVVTICNRLRFTTAEAQNRKFESNNRSANSGKAY